MTNNLNMLDEPNAVTGRRDRQFDNPCDTGGYGGRRGPSDRPGRGFSTTEPPYENAVIGILEAAAQIGETTGRQLIQDDGTLLMPQTSERDGVSSVIALTSAAGLMGMVITAVASEVSARSALRASRATYTSVLQVVTLDDAAKACAEQDASWIERQVQALIGLRPDVVLMTGGLDGGVEDALVRLSHIVGLTALNTRSTPMASSATILPPVR